MDRVELPEPEFIPEEPYFHTGGSWFWIKAAGVMAFAFVLCAIVVLTQDLPELQDMEESATVVIFEESQTETDCDTLVGVVRWPGVEAEEHVEVPFGLWVVLMLGLMGELDLHSDGVVEFMDVLAAAQMKCEEMDEAEGQALGQSGGADS